MVLLAGGRPRLRFAGCGSEMGSLPAGQAGSWTTRLRPAPGVIVMATASPRCKIPPHRSHGHPDRASVLCSTRLVGGCGGVGMIEG
jgi:hypothetical protein